MVDFFNEVALSTQNIPLLYAFMLGILTSISPCPLASNIAAVAFISKEIENKSEVFWSGMLYTMGRMVTYFLVGLLLLTAAFSRSEISEFLQCHINTYLGPLLIILGIFLLNILPIRWNLGSGFIIKVQDKAFQNGRWKLGAFLIGMFFSLGFCPISAVWFFTMIGIALDSTGGFIFPLTFGLGTGVPVIIFALLLVFSVTLMGNVFNKVKAFEKWFRIVAGVVFIFVGIYLTLSQTLGLC